ncbi:hypothetical protein GCM10009504_38490 [Pseudomonas laurentiana]|nr:hypothetical protein GCM10009504_38490 [Pseudomonas laurentiana]
MNDSGRKFSAAHRALISVFIAMEVDDGIQNVKILPAQHGRQICSVLKNDKWLFAITAESCTITRECIGFVQVLLSITGFYLTVFNSQSLGFCHGDLAR